MSWTLRLLVGVVVMNCLTVEASWCSMRNKDMTTSLNKWSSKNKLAKRACKANSKCTGVVKEKVNGKKQFTQKTGDLKDSKGKVTWTKAACKWCAKQNYGIKAAGNKYTGGKKIAFKKAAKALTVCSPRKDCEGVMKDGDNYYLFYHASGNYLVPKKGSLAIRKGSCKKDTVSNKNLQSRKGFKQGTRKWTG